MPGCISIFRRTAVFFCFWLMLVGATATAAELGRARPEEPVGGGDEIISGPFSEYGEFDSNEDEAADERFFSVWTVLRGWSRRW